MATINVPSGTDSRNLISRRAALQSTAALGAMALPAGAAVAAMPGDAAVWPEIEAALDKILRTWARARSETTCARYHAQRLELLERAAATPINSNADAAAAMRVMMKASDGVDWANTAYAFEMMGGHTDIHRANIARSVERYLRASA